MRLNYLWLPAMLLLAAPAYAQEKGTLEKVYEGALKAAKEVFGPEERPHQVDKNKQPQIIIKGGELRYNGRLLKLGDTLVNWEKVLGKPSRFSGDNYHTWDNLGIGVVLKARGTEGPGFTNKITQLDIFLTRDLEIRFLNISQTSDPKMFSPAT